MNQSIIEQRLAIIKDAIEQLNLGVVRASHAYLLAGIEKDGGIDNGDSLQELLKDAYYCDVCAKGSLFLSAVRLHNKFNIDDKNIIKRINSWNIDIEHEQIIDYLNKQEALFNNHELDLIECAFECNDAWYEWPENSEALIEGLTINEVEDLISRAVDFGDKYNSNKEKLLAILTNMLNNNSYFTI